MRGLLLATVAIGVWLPLVFQRAGQSEKRVVQSNSSADDDKSKETTQKQQPADSETIRSILSMVAQSQQQQAQELKASESEKDQEITIERQLVKYTRWLVIVGAVQFVALIVQAIVFWRTLIQFRNTARDENVSLIRLNRAYLVVDTWMIDVVPATGSPGKVGITFAILNPSRTAARIERVDYSVGNLTFAESYGTMLTPRERHWIRIPHQDTEDKQVIAIRGRITYRDIFRRERHRTFAKDLVCGATQSTFHDADGIGLNDEEEWDQDN